MRGRPAGPRAVDGAVLMGPPTSTANVAKSSGRGSKPGERRGGRVKGTPNKATADLKALAQKYTASAVAELARLATQAESEAARVAAIKELLDRGHGKATQLIGGDHNQPVRHLVDLTDAALAAIAAGGAK